MTTQNASGEIIKSCLTDKPLQPEDKDTLKASDYADALAQFIKNADTPVTIGIQGGWGSGKTSLITVLQHQLENDPSHRAICVLVNAWEHSLFHNTDSKAEVALSLLNGLASGIKKSVNKIIQSKDNRWLDKSAENVVNPQDNTVEKAITFIRNTIKLAGKIGVQVASNVAGTGDMSNVWNNISKVDDLIPPLAENVHNLRKGLENMIEQLKYKGEEIKVVFFIDDLDRVPPPTAVEILDITKNIFDIPHCVFVLAIDYEVIVKGLEEKFGKKDTKNEREFRQYFDKIIQIPFTMPMGAYGENLHKLIEPALKKLGYTLDDADKTILNNLADDAKMATGGIPRSIKRIINTLSLLQHITNAKLKKSSSSGLIPLPKDIEARFIIVSLLINFPEICKKIMERPNFPEWSPTTLNLLWKLKIDENKKELDALEKAGSTKDLFDDDWEKVLFCVCSQSDWLKSQVVNLSKLLNRLLIVLNNGQVENKLSTDGLDMLNTILEGIKVVSVDAASQVNMRFDDSSVKSDRVTQFCINLQNALSAKLSQAIIPSYEAGWAKRGEGGKRTFEVKINGDNGNIYLFYITWEKSEAEIFFGFYSTRHGKSQKKSIDVAEKIFGEKYSFEGSELETYISEGFSYDDFATKNPQQFVDKILTLYSLTEKAEKALSNI